MRGEDGKAPKQVCKETWKDEERTGRENTPALARLVLLSSGADTSMPRQLSWHSKVSSAQLLCTLCSLDQVFLKVLSIKQKYLESGILPSTERNNLKF